MYIQVEEFEDVETDDIFFIATDSEGDTELEDEDFSLDELQELDSEFAADPALTRFPLGCKIWYNARTSRVSTNRLRAKSASVVGVYMHYEKLQKVYKLKSDTPTQCDIFLCEDRLAYGMTCPVTVIDASTNDVRDGVIVCPKLYQVGGGDGEQQVSSYDVQILHGSDIIVEFGVAADRIKYRFEKPTKNVCPESKTRGRGEREESSVVKDVKAKGKEEADEEEPKELPKCRQVSTKNNDDTESALKPSTQQPDTSTASSSVETTSGAISAVAKAGASHIDPDDYWSW
ncbi:hypothetical protein QTG54_011673 [Skeletonema marinoi]|uniref:Uncharacterized protein n=1 Tax=Skeletonema marinoi TaxID=267567 RepID=A0AAD8Y0Y3_9STRA|nr:hypothetical protein QTG54_011673 [Skeletonema marinoi]